MLPPPAVDNQLTEYHAGDDGAVQVQFAHAGEVLKLEVEEGLLRTDRGPGPITPRGVDQDIQAAPLLGQLVAGGGEACHVGDVAPQ